LSIDRTTAEPTIHDERRLVNIYCVHMERKQS